MPKFRTHYDNLKVARNAPDTVIRAAYRTLMQQYHPDKYEGNKQEAHRISKIIIQSYEILIDPIKRAEHDQRIDERLFSQQSKNKIQEQHQGKNSKHSNKPFKKKTYHLAKELIRCFARILYALREVIIAGFIITISVAWSNYKTSEYNTTQVSVKQNNHQEFLDKNTLSLGNESLAITESTSEKSDGHINSKSFGITNKTEIAKISKQSIDKNPVLSYWQKNNPDIFNACIVDYNNLHKNSDFVKLSLIERLQLVTKRQIVIYGNPLEVEAFKPMDEYQGGTDRKNWGPRTVKYIERVGSGIEEKQVDKLLAEFNKSQVENNKPQESGQPKSSNEIDLIDYLDKNKPGWKESKEQPPKPESTEAEWVDAILADFKAGEAADPDFWKPKEEPKPEDKMTAAYLKWKAENKKPVEEQTQETPEDKASRLFWEWKKNNPKQAQSKQTTDDKAIEKMSADFGEWLKQKNK